MRAIAFSDRRLSIENPEDNIWFVYDFTTNVCTKYVESPDVIHPFFMCCPHSMKRTETVVPVDSYDYATYRHIAEKYAQMYSAEQMYNNVKNKAQVYSESTRITDRSYCSSADRS